QQTFTIVEGPGRLLAGADKERQARMHRFAIGATEITVHDFLKFRPKHKYSEQASPKQDCPANMVSWQDAAVYCNWLSEQDGIPKGQWCYRPTQPGQYAEVAPSHALGAGYRLPSEVEWEYASRSGASTSWCCGEVEPDLLVKYAWFFDNSHFGTTLRSSPVAT